MTIGNRIKSIRESKGISQVDLANAVKISKQTLYKYENGIITNIPSDKIEGIANFLRISPSYLMGWDGKKNSKLLSPTITDNTITFPVFGEVAAGYDEIAVEDWSGETIEIPASYLKGRDKSEFFVLSVKGNSMYPQYQSGDRVLVLKQNTLNRSGDVGVILYDSEYATLKRVEYVYGEDWMRLIPINPEYIPKLIEGADLEQCRVLGVPRLIIRELA